MESPLVTLKHASKSFVDGKETHRVLEGVDFTLNTGASVALTGASGSGTVFLLGIWLSAPLIASIYLGNANDLIPIAASALTFYFFGVPLMGLNMVIANLFQAIAKPKQATLISLCRGFVFVALGVLLLPKFFPQDGIWASIVFAETLTAVISLSMLFNYRKRAVELTTSLARSS